MMAGEGTSAPVVSQSMVPCAAVMSAEPVAEAAMNPAAVMTESRMMSAAMVAEVAAERDRSARLGGWCCQADCKGQGGARQQAVTQHARLLRSAESVSTRGLVSGESLSQSAVLILTDPNQAGSLAASTIQR